MTTCTVRSSFGRCGKPAVYVHPPTDRGEVFAECAEHAADPMALARPLSRGSKPKYHVGEIVTVYRYGREYSATVCHVGPRGAAYAEFTYGNGARRRVRV